MNTLKEKFHVAARDPQRFPDEFELIYSEASPEDKGVLLDLVAERVCAAAASVQYQCSAESLTPHVTVMSGSMKVLLDSNYYNAFAPGSKGAQDVVTRLNNVSSTLGTSARELFSLLAARNDLKLPTSKSAIADFMSRDSEAADLMGEIMQGRAQGYGSGPAK